MLNLRESLDNVIFSDGVNTKREEFHALIEVYQLEGASPKDLRDAIEIKLLDMYAGFMMKKSMEMAAGMYGGENAKDGPLYVKENPDKTRKLQNVPDNILVWCMFLDVLDEDYGENF